MLDDSGDQLGSCYVRVPVVELGEGEVVVDGRNALASIARLDQVGGRT